MRASALGRSIASVSDGPHSIDLTVSVDQDSHDIRGHVTGNDGKSHMFSGWLELMSVIGAAREGSRSACGEPRQGRQATEEA
jgi:hypothetical protein